MQDLGFTGPATCWQSAAYIWNIVLRCDCSLVIGHIKRYFFTRDGCARDSFFCVPVDTQAGLAINIFLPKNTPMGWQEFEHTTF